MLRGVGLTASIALVLFTSALAGNVSALGYDDAALFSKPESKNAYDLLTEMGHGSITGSIARQLQAEKERDADLNNSVHVAHRMLAETDVAAPAPAPVHVDFPGGGVEVSSQGVDVKFPGGEVNVGRKLKAIDMI